jgi:hypothetical protein
MTIREFTDSNGVVWRVWSSVPPKRITFDERLRGGWLTFESALGRRRLAPIPPAWQEASAEQLEEMCVAAEPARLVRGRGAPPDRPDAPGTPQE